MTGVSRERRATTIIKAIAQGHAEGEDVAEEASFKAEAHHHGNACQCHRGWRRNCA